jgi:hypothetical protein
MWYLIQASVAFAVIWLLHALGIPRQAPTWIFGIAAALWITVVWNSMIRARELRRQGSGWFARWCREVWAAEALGRPS